MIINLFSILVKDFQFLKLDKKIKSDKIGKRNINVFKLCEGFIYENKKKKVHIFNFIFIYYIFI